MRILKYYSNAVAICIFTAWFGIGLLESNRNVIDRVDLFAPRLDLFIGALMIGLSILKVISLFLPQRKLKKITLLGIALLWVFITWAYLNNDVPNVGYRMSGLITTICYLELWRGDYAG